MSLWQVNINTGAVRSCGSSPKRNGSFSAGGNNGIKTCLAENNIDDDDGNDNNNYTAEEEKCEGGVTFL